MPVSGTKSADTSDTLRTHTVRHTSALTCTWDPVYVHKRVDPQLSWQLHILGCLHCASCPLSDPEGSSSLAVGNLVRTWFTAVGCSPSALGASRRHMEPSLAPLMVARSWSPSRPPSGAQQHQLVRPDDSYLLYRTDAAAQLAQHSPRTPHPSSLEPPPRDGPRDYLHELLVGGAAHETVFSGSPSTSCVSSRSPSIYAFSQQKWRDIFFYLHSTLPRRR